MRFWPQWMHAYRLVRTAIYLLAFFGCVATLLTRLHYTLDVVIAIYLTWRSWDGYHSRTKPGSKKYAAGVIQWLEDDEILGMDERGYDKARLRATSSTVDDDDEEDT